MLYLENIQILLTYKLKAMKKIILIPLIMGFCFFYASGQLLVDDNGNVGIKAGQKPFSSTLSIGNNGSPNRMVNVYSTNHDRALRVERTGTPTQSLNWLTGIQGYSAFTDSRVTVGIWGVAYIATPQSRGRSIGIKAEAGNSTSGYNYGVYGQLRGSNNGAGIVGIINSEDLYIDGMYAGYFAGNVKVTGTINGTLISNSDIRYKKNITSFSNERTRALDEVISLNPVKYNYQEVYKVPESPDSVATSVKPYDGNLRNTEVKQFGLIAQELQAVYPELVFEDQNGYLSINYTGLIPVLIQSIKELSQEIEDLKITTNTNDFKSNEYDNAILYQNNPNPFSSSTEIGYYLPKEVSTAYLCFYDMQGKQLKQIALNQRGKCSESIPKSQFSPGMYMYAMIVDGKEIDTKKMIITE